MEVRSGVHKLANKMDPKGAKCKIELTELNACGCRCTFGSSNCQYAWHYRDNFQKQSMYRRQAASFVSKFVASGLMS